MAFETKVALVTGASRGIGRCAALWLADRGFDVAVAARTLRADQERPTYPDGTPYAGSLEETAAEIETRGRRALPLAFDLDDRATATHVVDTLLSQWGRVDVLVNNALVSPEPTHARLLELDPDVFLQAMDANVGTPLVLTQGCLADMLARGEGGVLINVSSGAGRLDPPAPHGEGGWSWGYGAVKAVQSRMVPHLAVEHGAEGIRAYALEPGGVPTDSFKASIDPAALKVLMAHPDIALVSEDVPASVIAWLATAPEAAAFSGRVLDAETVCREQGLLPEAGMRPPGFGTD